MQLFIVVSCSLTVVRCLLLIVSWSLSVVSCLGIAFRSLQRITVRAREWDWDLSRLWGSQLDSESSPISHAPPWSRSTSDSEQVSSRYSSAIYRSRPMRSVRRATVSVCSLSHCAVARFLPFAAVASLPDPWYEPWRDTAAKSRTLITTSLCARTTLTWTMPMFTGIPPTLGHDMWVLNHLEDALMKGSLIDVARATKRSVQPHKPTSPCHRVRDVSSLLWTMMVTTNTCTLGSAYIFRRSPIVSMTGCVKHCYNRTGLMTPCQSTLICELSDPSVDSDEVLTTTSSWMRTSLWMV